MRDYDLDEQRANDIRAQLQEKQAQKVPMTDTTLSPAQL